MLILCIYRKQKNDMEMAKDREINALKIKKRELMGEVQVCARL